MPPPADDTARKVRKSSSSSSRPKAAAAAPAQDADGALPPDVDAGLPDAQAAPTPKGPMAVGRSLELATTPDVCMEALVDKLKLLEYEKEFLRKKKSHRKPLGRLYFAVPHSGGNSNDQFFYFASLAVWLAGLAGIDIPAPKEFDDPNTTCTNILNAAKKLGFAAPAYHPTKLTVGWGKEVLGVLDGLTDYALERKSFAFKKPNRGPEGDGEDGDVDDNDEMGGADSAITFEMPTYMDEHEEEAYMMSAEAGAGGGASRSDGGAASAGGRQPSVPSDKAIMQSKVDPTLWKLELERVAPKLRILLNADSKDWRSHLEEVHQHTKTISSTWPDSKAVLEKLRADLNASLDKLTTRERFLNDQFDRLMQQYRAARTQMQQVQGSYNAHTEAISERNNELHRISEQLEEIKLAMDERGSNISDARPVVQMKNAIKKLSGELHEMEVRIGVVSHTLLELSMKNKRLMQAQAAALSDEEDEENM